MKSNFWRYREYKSKSFRLKGSNPGSFIKPIYFPEAIDGKGFRKWLRQSLGMNYSEHIEIDPCASISDFESQRAINAHNRSIEPIVKRPRKKRKQVIFVDYKSLPFIVKEALGNSCLSVR